ncbi:hypothetical protein C8R47DRAFT_1091092 [Mycena vitilis]|nr:hypothetical protein C8R47DRAFT_1091092 [Mycena vitilis]
MRTSKASRVIPRRLISRRTRCVPKYERCKNIATRVTASRRCNNLGVVTPSRCTLLEHGHARSRAYRQAWPPAALLLSFALIPRRPFGCRPTSPDPCLSPRSVTPIQLGRAALARLDVYIIGCRVNLDPIWTNGSSMRTGDITTHKNAVRRTFPKTCCFTRGHSSSENPSSPHNAPLCPLPLTPRSAADVRRPISLYVGSPSSWPSHRPHSCLSGAAAKQSLPRWMHRIAPRRALCSHVFVREAGVGVLPLHYGVTIATACFACSPSPGRAVRRSMRIPSTRRQHLDVTPELQESSRLTNPVHTQCEAFYRLWVPTNVLGGFRQLQRNGST